MSRWASQPPALVLGPALALASGVEACRSGVDTPAGRVPIERRAGPGLVALSGTVAEARRPVATGTITSTGAGGPRVADLGLKDTVRSITGTAAVGAQTRVREEDAGGAGEARAARAELAGQPSPPGTRDPRDGKAIIPESGAEGPRELAKLAELFRRRLLAEPFGKRWKDVVHVAPAPKDQRELGRAETHPALANDPIELQQQAQFLEETGAEGRYGFVSIRAVRVWRFGKLAAVRLVLDKLGRETSREAFARDLDALAVAWKNVPAALSLGNGFKMVKHDLIEQKALRPAEYPKAPLSIELVPMERGG